MINNIEQNVDQFLKDIELQFSKLIKSIRQPLIDLYSNSQQIEIQKQYILNQAQQACIQINELVTFLNSQIQPQRKKTIKVVENIDQNPQISAQSNQQIKQEQRLSFSKNEQQIQIIDYNDDLLEVMKQCGISKKDMKDPVIAEMVLNALREFKLTQSTAIQQAVL